MVCTESSVGIFTFNLNFQLLLLLTRPDYINLKFISFAVLGIRASNSNSIPVVILIWGKFIYLFDFNEDSSANRLSLLTYIGLFKFFKVISKKSKIITCINKLHIYL